MKKGACYFLLLAVLFVPLLLSVQAFGQEPYTFVLKWGGTGTGPGEFGAGWFTSGIFGIAIDSKDNVYVADTWNYRVQKFDKIGNYILQWGSQGHGAGEFIFPGGIVIDKNDNVYVSDGSLDQGSRVQKFDSQGNFLALWDNINNADLGMDIDKSGNIFILAYDNPAMKKFDPGMNYLSGNGYCGHPRNDNELLNFCYPEDIAVNSKGEIFVSLWGEFYCGLPYGHDPEFNTDFHYHSQIKKFDSNLQYVSRWYLDHVTGIAVDSEDNVLACSVRDWDMGVYKYDSNGNLIQRIAPNASPDNPQEDGKISAPLSIAIDSEGNVYVGDLLNRIQKFAPPLKKYTFEGFFSPIDNPPTVNKANAGQAIPVKWRITDKNGQPISDPASFINITSYNVNCATFEGDPINSVEEFAAGSSGLQYLGDGWWQFNWKTSKTYKGQCRTMKLTLDDKSEHTASFSFK